jgi:hypothetical protein
MALVTTPGSATADSYISLTEADIYAAARFGSDVWSALSDADQEKALRQATRDIDRGRFRGVKTNPGQALQFPRDYRSESAADSLDVPDEVQEACFEQALWVAQHSATGGRSVRQQLQSEGVRSFRVGSTAETFEGSGMRWLCPEASALLAPWIERWGRIVIDGREEG